MADPGLSPAPRARWPRLPYRKQTGPVPAAVHQLAVRLWRVLLGPHLIPVIARPGWHRACTVAATRSPAYPKLTSWRSLGAPDSPRAESVSGKRSGERL